MTRTIDAPPGLGAFLVAERRETVRVLTPARVNIRGLDGNRGTEVSTIVDNVSAGGFYVRLMEKVEAGSCLFAVINFPPGRRLQAGAISLAVRGRVQRVEELPGGTYGVAVRVLKHRFI